MKADLCPVCNGRGQVAEGFYSLPYTWQGTNTEQCKSCEGRGWVEIREDYTYPTYESHSTTDYGIVEHEIIPKTE